MVNRCTAWLVRLTPVLALCLTGWAQSADVPLGDLVKQPKPVKRAARVITNDDLPQRPPEPSPASSPAGSTSTANNGPAQGAPTSKTQPEAKEAKSEPGATQSDTSAENNPPAESKSGQAAAKSENARINKRISDLDEQEAAEQKIHDRLSDALQHSGMSDAQHQALVDALGQSEAELAGIHQQRDILKEFQATPPNKAEGDASKPDDDSPAKTEQPTERPTI